MQACVGLATRFLWEAVSIIKTNKKDTSSVYLGGNKLCWYLVAVPKRLWKLDGFGSSSCSMAGKRNQGNFIAARFCDLHWNCQSSAYHPNVQVLYVNNKDVHRRFIYYFTGILRLPLVLKKEFVRNVHTMDCKDTFCNYMGRTANVNNNPIKVLGCCWVKKLLGELLFVYGNFISRRSLLTHGEHYTHW